VRWTAVALLLVPLTLAGSAPAQPAGEPLDAALQRARAEQAAAEKETARLQRAASQARGEADRLRAQQAAAAQAIEAAEARITASNAQLQLASVYVAAHQQRLARERQPVSALLAGLAVMARRPPLLALADHGVRGDDRGQQGGRDQQHEKRGADGLIHCTYRDRRADAKDGDQGFDEEDEREQRHGPNDEGAATVFTELLAKHRAQTSEAELHGCDAFESSSINCR